jgi:hypothetical protein
MVTLYVEGGGDSQILKTACRRSFAEFLTKAGLKNRMPRIYACGSRQQAYKDFCTAITHAEEAFLLIDSEELVAPHHQQGVPGMWLPWAHLKSQDQWDMPSGATNLQCHLMTVVTESWFLADQATLTAFFGQGFNPKPLPSVANGVESIAKQHVYQALTNATSKCKTKAPYGKGEHSFKILALISPAQVINASPWAARFIEALKGALQ